MLTDVQKNANNVLVGVKLMEVEQELLKATVIYTKGNRTVAASLLGVTDRTIRNHLPRKDAILNVEVN